MIRSLLAALTLTGLLATPAPAGAVDPAPHRSSTSAPDQAIRDGCRPYRYRYRIAAAGEEWMAEIQLLSPRGRRLANVTVTSEAQRPAARRTWRVCSANLRPGVHTIRMLVTSYDAREVSEAWAPPSTFRLAR